jgi:hypothetical protein
LQPPTLLAMGSLAHAAQVVHKRHYLTVGNVLVGTQKDAPPRVTIGV